MVTFPTLLKNGCYITFSPVARNIIENGLVTSSTNSLRTLDALYKTAQYVGK